MADDEGKQPVDLRRAKFDETTRIANADSLKRLEAARDKTERLREARMEAKRSK